MTEKELEYLLLENLKLAKENHHYIIQIDRRQRWARNWKAFSFSVVLIILMVIGYFSLPYFTLLASQVKYLHDQVGQVLGTASSVKQ
jgi:hypothetical protein